MTAALNSYAEKAASKAEDLPAFSGLKLLHIKRQVAELLGQIGGNGIFDSYTRHDISHIDEMLKSLEWLITEPVKAAMTPADWLLSVLAIYFHDMGMLVTREEYESRSDSGFPQYRDTILLSGAAGTDYAAKLSGLSKGKRERFLYQEFVRATHGERIRSWLGGKSNLSLGNAEAVFLELNNLFNHLDKQFRQDLGTICESHHLDDLDDFEKYPLARPYGNSQSETANLQFAAITLRTADLLHITRDRTPPIAFRLISPSDPISQREWAKQMAVKAVRSKVAHNVDGEFDDEAPRDTVEIHAFFEKPNGFFGLTSYLIYVGEQLKQNFEWLQKAQKARGSKHTLPWRRVDDSNVKTDGFLKESFEFSLDNARILDLLTGHTLYDDTSVVLRELVQNSLDAVRVQGLVEPGSSNQGLIEIRWNSAPRVLEVRDNGTGMTQQVIETNFLRAGSSRYQSQEFQREHPDFSSISRFGIGILSTFMIADEVEVTTCHPDDTDVRKLTLRSVHGKYLVQLLSKETATEAVSLLPHGTSIRISLRASTPEIDIEAQARRWVVVPSIKVTLQVDDGPVVDIGHGSAKEALADVLERCDVPVSQSSTAEASPHEVRIVENSVHGLDMAFAIEWSEHFRTWSFMTLESIAGRRSDRLNLHPDALIGTCVEGIRVDSAPPGFRSRGIMCIANATGKGAPRTNVARSGLENTPEKQDLISNIYSIYCKHVEQELDSLQNDRSCSLSWAVREARVVLSRLAGLSGNADVLHPELLIASAAKLNIFVAEEKGERSAVSADSLALRDEFWTVDAPFFNSAEDLITEVESRASLGSIVSALDVSGLEVPTALILSRGANKSMLDNHALHDWEVDMVQIDRKHRRADLRWRKLEGKKRWEFLVYEDVRGALVNSRARHRARSEIGRSVASADTALALRSGIVLATADVGVRGITTEAAVQIRGLIYVLPDTRLGDYLQSWLDKTSDSGDSNIALLTIVLFDIAEEVISSRSGVRTQSYPWGEALGGSDSGDGLTRDQVVRRCEIAGVTLDIAGFEPAQFGALLRRDNTNVFCPSAWRRGNED